MSATHETPQPAGEPPPQRKASSRRFRIGLTLGVFLGFASIMLLAIVLSPYGIWLSCDANVSGISRAIALYQSEYDRPPLSPEHLIRGFSTSWKLFDCPAADSQEYRVGPRPGSEEWDEWNAIAYVLIPIDEKSGGNAAMVFDLPANHRQQRCYFGLADGRVMREMNPGAVLPAVQQANDYHARMREKP